MRMIDTHFHIGVIPHEWQHILGLCELDTVIVPSDQMVPDFLPSTWSRTITIGS